MRFPSPKRRTAFFVLATLLIALVSLPSLVHASSYVGYAAANQGSSTCGSNCAGNVATTDAIGEVIQSPLAGQLVSAGFFTGSSVPNRIVILVGTTSTASTTYSCGSAGTCAQANDGQPFTVKDVEGLSGLAGSTFFTVNLASPVTVTQNQWVGIVFIRTTDTNPILMAVGSGGQTTTLDTCFAFGTTNPTINNSFNTALATCGTSAMIVGGTFTATGTTGTTVTVTQCYGNCGSPAITLANTNSTHTINFNQSITVLYEFQSNLNGFLVNVTTSVAKSYNNGVLPSLAFYQIPTCPNGQLPFTTQCPALQMVGGSPVGSNPAKGKMTLSVSNGLYPVSNGQWLAIAVTASLSGFDLNDTNTNVPLFQTPGQIPSSLTQVSPGSGLCAGCKMGLWAFILGNVVSGAGASQPSFANCGPGLDCILTNVVNSFCSVITTACQTSSAMFWTIILTIITIMVVAFGFSSILPTVNLGRTGLAELSVLVFVMWVAIFTSFNLMSIYVLAIIFSVVALLMGRKVNSYI